ncbi:MAG: hypothetical protein CML99_13040 [Rhodobiaceae bacterium]|nr:hypothetical protein [Rhodobiaceae bacterium]
MKKLLALRTHLLSRRFGLKKDQLICFAENGRVVSVRGERNRNFRLTYEANIIAQDYERGPLELAYAILEWLHAHEPELSPDSLRFEAELLDTEKTDLGFQVELSEDIAVTVEDEGIRLEVMSEPVPDPDALSGFSPHHID